MDGMHGELLLGQLKEWFKDSFILYQVRLQITQDNSALSLIILLSVTLLVAAGIQFRRGSRHLRTFQIELS